MTDPDPFETWWASYPRKVGKGAARRIWARLKPDAETQAQMMAAVERLKSSPEWKKDGGQFIPHPRTFLGQNRWEDVGPGDDPPDREDAQLVWVRLCRGIEDLSDGAYLRTLVTATWEGASLAVYGETPAAGAALARQWDVLVARATERGVQLWEV